MQYLRAIFTGIASLFLFGCAATDPPSPAIQASSRADASKSYSEGASKAFTAAPTEPAQTDPLTALMLQVADTGSDEPLTPEEFRSPAGARVMRLEF